MKLDERSLGAFRIALGGVLLADLGQRALDLEVHYTDLPHSLVPRGLAALGTPAAQLPWPHLWAGEAAWSWLLFALSALAATALLLGWRTRMATVACWLLWASLHSRNPFVLHRGDTMLRLMLLGAAFLPIGARFSLDERAGRSPQAAGALASTAFAWQLAFVYTASVAYKIDPAWWPDLDAVRLALEMDDFTTALGRRVGAGSPALLSALAAGTLVFELVAPLLVFHRRTRRFAVVAFVGFHLALGSMLRLGLFTLIPIVWWVALWPGRADAVARPLIPRGARYASAVLLLYVLGWNAAEILDFRARQSGGPALQGALAWPGYLLRVDQRWSMFAPRPGTSAMLRLGAGAAEPVALDPFTPRNVRWRKFGRHIQRGPHAPLVARWCQSLCADEPGGPLELEARVKGNAFWWPFASYDCASRTLHEHAPLP